MRAGALAFRFRVPIFLSLYLLGFLAPWGWAIGGRRDTLWLAASTLLARIGWINLAGATLAVTLLALASLTIGAVFRVWGTAYLGSAIMRGAVLRGESIVAAGPYRYLRNPLYLGSWMLALGTSVLMSPTGALIFLPSFTLFTLLLIYTEERFLTANAGAVYLLYCREVPRLFPRFLPKTGTMMVRPQWLSAFLAEIYPVAFPLCFAVFAWRYNALILIRCLIVCYGVSLIVRALLVKTPDKFEMLSFLE